MARAARLIDFEFLLLGRTGLLKRGRLLVPGRPVLPEMAEMRAIRPHDPLRSVMRAAIRPVMLVFPVRPSVEWSLISSHSFSLVRVPVS